LRKANDLASSINSKKLKQVQVHQETAARVNQRMMAGNLKLWQQTGCNCVPSKK